MPAAADLAAPDDRGSRAVARASEAPQSPTQLPRRRTDAREPLHGRHHHRRHRQPRRRRRNKRRRRIGGWIALGVVLLILGGIAAGGLWVWNTYEPQIREVMGWEEPKDYAEGLANGEVFVTVAAGRHRAARSRRRSTTPA